MKKLKITALLLSLCMLFVALTSCDIASFFEEEESSAYEPKDGTDGLSAYEIAIKNGFTGTEAEWLESLKADTEIVEKQPIINQEITENNIAISTTGGDLTSATSKGLASAVSVFAHFTGEHGSLSSSAGSGVIASINADGDAFIVTNYHVVFSTDSITENGISDNIVLYLYGMEHIEAKIEATYVGGSMNYDLAVLRVEDNEILASAYARGTARAVEVAKKEVLPGQRVIAIGNPSAEGIAVTSGIISVDSEYIRMYGADNSTTVEFRVMRTDTPINQGNSGGGLYNDNGELVGIVNAKIISSDVENIGYAIPADVCNAIVKNIIYYCLGQECESVVRPLLGISLQVSETWTELNISTGLIEKHEKSKVVLVTEGSLADGKIFVGDTVTGIKVANGNKITVERQYHLIDALINARVGETVEITVERAETGAIETVTFTITEECLTLFK
jgi:serine protease Do